MVKNQLCIYSARPVITRKPLMKTFQKLYSDVRFPRFSTTPGFDRIAGTKLRLGTVDLVTEVEQNCDAFF